MKTLVYGAGTLGSLCAARLKEAGKDVTLLARGSRLEFLRHNGIILEHAVTGHSVEVPVDLVDSLQPDDAYDLVIVLMGQHQLPGVLPSLQENRHTPNLLFMGNNVLGARGIEQNIGRERILLGFYLAAGTVKNGRVWYADDTERGRRTSTIGELDGSRTTRVEGIASELRSSGIPVEVSPNIDAYLKTHAAIVLPLAGGVYLAQGGLDGLITDDATIYWVTRLWKEAFHTLDALKVPVIPGMARIYQRLPSWLIVLLMKRILKNPLMKISFAHGEKARQEMACLAKDFLTLASEAGIETPALQEMSSRL